MYRNCDTCSVTATDKMFHLKSQRGVLGMKEQEAYEVLSLAVNFLSDKIKNNFMKNRQIKLWECFFIFRSVTFCLLISNLEIKA